MPTFETWDGLRLFYQDLGTGPGLVCVPGGPMRDTTYFADLGGLSAIARLIMLDLRGTGQSQMPADLATCRCDRLGDDVEALRRHLGFDQIDLLGHSAGANIAVRYAERHPDRVRRLLLIAPSTRAVGLTTSYEQRREVADMRKDEPWYPDAVAALERVNSGEGRDEDWDLVVPLFYSRWDAATQALHAAGEAKANEDVIAAYMADGAFEPETTRAAIGRLDCQVLVLAVEADPNTPPVVAAEYAAMFAHSELVVQPSAGHYPWLADPDWFRDAISSFLESHGS